MEAESREEVRKALNRVDEVCHSDFAQHCEEEVADDEGMYLELAEEEAADAYQKWIDSIIDEPEREEVAWLEARSLEARKFDPVAEEVARRMRAGEGLGQIAMAIGRSNNEVWRRANFARQLALLPADDVDGDGTPASQQRVSADLARARGELSRLQRRLNLKEREESESSGWNLREALLEARQELGQKDTILQATVGGVMAQAMAIVQRDREISRLMVLLTGVTGENAELMQMLSELSKLAPRSFRT